MLKVLLNSGHVLQAISEETEMEWMSWLAMVLAGLCAANLRSVVKKLHQHGELKDSVTTIGLEARPRRLAHPVTRSVENCQSLITTVAILLAIINIGGLF